MAVIPNVVLLFLDPVFWRLAISPHRYLCSARTKKMTSHLPNENICLDKLFSVSSDSDACESGIEILNEAVNAITADRRGSESKYRLYDPAIARVNRLFEGETLDSWLVRAAGLVEDQDVIEAYELASTANLFVLDVLNRSGKLSHSDVRAVFEAEALVSEGVLYRGFAAVALRLACRSYIDLNEALSILDIHPNKPFSRARLSNLLTKIELVDEEHLMLARLEALAKGITLGWSLIKNECVDEQMLKVLIEASFSIRERRIAESEVISTAIIALSSPEGAYPEARLVSELDLATLDRAFGNLLLASSIIGIEELLFCAEVAVEEGESLESVVGSFEIVEPSVLNGACQLARMLLNRKISARECTVLLSKLKNTGRTLAELLSSENEKSERAKPGFAPANTAFTLTARTA